MTNYRKIVAVLASLISIGLVVYSVTKVPLDELLSSLVLVGAYSIPVIIVIVILMTLFHITRWLIMCRLIIPSVGSYHLVINLFIGMFFNQTFPFGGDAARILHLLHLKTPASQAIISLMFDRAFAFTALFFIAIIGFFLQSVYFPESLLAISLVGVVPYVAVFIIVVPLSLLLVFVYREQLLRYFSSYSNFVSSFLHSLTSFISMTISNPASTIACFFCAVAVQLLTCSIPLSVILLANWNLNLIALFTTIATVLIIAYLPISIAGWGVRETGFVVIAPYIGVSDSQAVILALILGCSQLIQGLVCGALFSLTSLKQASKKELNNL